jgi:hypothetical protein
MAMLLAWLRLAHRMAAAGLDHAAHIPKAFLRIVLMLTGTYQVPNGKNLRVFSWQTFGIEEVCFM